MGAGGERGNICLARFETSASAPEQHEKVPGDRGGACASGRRGGERRRVEWANSFFAAGFAIPRGWMRLNLHPRHAGRAAYMRHGTTFRIVVVTGAAKEVRRRYGRSSVWAPLARNRDRAKGQISNCPQASGRDARRCIDVPAVRVQTQEAIGGVRQSKWAGQCASRTKSHEIAQK